MNPLFGWRTERENVICVRVMPSLLSTLNWFSRVRLHWLFTSALTVNILSPDDVHLVKKQKSIGLLGSDVCGYVTCDSCYLGAKFHY